MDSEDLMKFYCLEVQKFCVLVRMNMAEEKKKKQRSCAVGKLMRERHAKGYHKNFIPSMRLNDVGSFINFHRMDAKTFDKLLFLLGPSMKEQQTRSAEEITSSERLSLILRYLASGDSMKSIGFYGFRVGASTTSDIMRSTCILIWEKLQFVFPTPSEEMWRNIAEDFYNKWGFPNTLGAIDGKHVIVQAFPNHNSLTYNYKHTHSLLLMAVADANCKFTLVDIGALGHNCDAGVFKASKFGNNILNNPAELKIPKEKTLPNSDVDPSFVFLADEAFPLRKNILRPYPGRNTSILPPLEDNFNIHLSKSRRVVENAFGIMASRFRIYRKPIIASKETVKNIVKATVCMHNWLRDKNTPEIEREVTADVIESSSDDAIGLRSYRSTHSNHASRDAVALRNKFAEYLLNKNR